MNKNDPKILVKDAISHFGTQSALGEALGITRSSVCEWSRDKYVPALNAHRLIRMEPRIFKKLDKAA